MDALVRRVNDVVRHRVPSRFTWPIMIVNIFAKSGGWHMWKPQPCYHEGVLILIDEVNKVQADTGSRAVVFSLGAMVLFDSCAALTELGITTLAS